MRRRQLVDSQPLDEQEQEKVIYEFESRKRKQEQFYQVVFPVVILLPTPFYVCLRYCRTHAVRSFLSLISIIGCAYSIYYGQHPRLAPAAGALALLILMNAVLEHWPWSGHDFLWLLPSTSAATAIVLPAWYQIVDKELEALKRSRYNLKGA